MSGRRLTMLGGDGTTPASDIICPMYVTDKRSHRVAFRLFWHQVVNITKTVTFHQVRHGRDDHGARPRPRRPAGHPVRILARDGQFQRQPARVLCRLRARGSVPGRLHVGLVPSSTLLRSAFSLSHTLSRSLALSLSLSLSLSADGPLSCRRVDQGLLLASRPNISAAQTSVRDPVARAAAALRQDLPRDRHYGSRAARRVPARAPRSPPGDFLVQVWWRLQ